MTKVQSFTKLTVEEIYTQLVLRLKNAREQRGWSRDTLSEKALVHLSTIKSMEEGRHIEMNKFIKICGALGFFDQIASLLSREFESEKRKSKEATIELTAKCLGYRIRYGMRKYKQTIKDDFPELKLTDAKVELQ